MRNSYATPARSFADGIGVAVASRTISRMVEKLSGDIEMVPFEVPRRDDAVLDDVVEALAKSQGQLISGYSVDYGDDLIVRGDLHVIGSKQRESWEDVAHRVALGNSMLEPELLRREDEFHDLNHHLRQASLLMSGRHLQHGDETQPERNMEVFCNCLDGSTRILTMEYGPIEIEKISGQVVTVIAGDGQPRSATINEHGEQELFDITFRQNTTGPAPGKMPVVRATANHRWKLADGSITDALRVGDVIAPATAITELDPQAVIHGLIYGDGSSFKKRFDHSRPGVSQGRTYAGIRVCKEDRVRDEIHTLLDNAGYPYCTPPHANGDRAYYLGKFPHAKELPFTNDPEYIAGFIYGWWLADGHKAISHALEISTASEEGALWLKEYASFAGYIVTMHRVMERKEGDGSFPNGKALNVIRIRQNLTMKVSAITPVGKAKVYCPEEPVTSTFVLANGLLTGNCATAAMTFLSFYLLLNGSGVGRSYDDAMMLVDWANMPITVPVIDVAHKDVQSGEILAHDYKTVKHLYAGRKQHYFLVPDSREGWAKAIEVIEFMAFKKERDTVLILDFSQVRPRGAPIKGMQNRPASGPGALMQAIKNIALLRDAGMAPWRSTMYADHYSAECVLVGGARRAARMSAKYWKDLSIFEFIEIKRGGFLWSSNNSVVVDAEFWTAVKKAQALIDESPNVDLELLTKIEIHAYRVFSEICKAEYDDQTGEPGLINGDSLTWTSKGIEALLDGNFAESDKYKLEEETLELTKALANAFSTDESPAICNPCGEIVLGKLGGYCVIADVVPYHSLSDDDAEDAFRVATRALIRTNLMDSMYAKEVKRTNRIGVGMTGIHEYAWARFEYGFRDIINEEKSMDFWLMLSRFKRAVQDEARIYSGILGVAVPHTNTTIKPAGCASLDTCIKTDSGVVSMRGLFERNGITERDLEAMEDGTWIEPKVKTMVLDEGNILREVTKLYKNGIKPVYEIAFEDGTVAKLTGNHKLKTVDGWKRVDELTVEDEIISY